MIHRLVKMTFKPAQAASFLEIFNASKDKIAAFEGCVELRLLKDNLQENVFFTYSIWQSEQHLENYKQSVLFKNTWKQTKALFDKPAEAWSTVVVY